MQHKNSWDYSRLETWFIAEYCLQMRAEVKNIKNLADNTECMQAHKKAWEQTIEWVKPKNLNLADYDKRTVEEFFLSTVENEKSYRILYPE